MDSLSEDGYARLKEITRRIKAWCKFGVVLGIGGMVGSNFMDDAVSSFFTFFVGLIVGACAFSVGLMSDISVRDYSADLEWKRKRESGQW